MISSHLHPDFWLCSTCDKMNIHTCEKFEWSLLVLHTWPFTLQKCSVSLHRQKVCVVPCILKTVQVPQKTGSHCHCLLWSSLWGELSSSWIRRTSSLVAFSSALMFRSPISSSVSCIRADLYVCHRRTETSEPQHLDHCLLLSSLVYFFAHHSCSRSSYSSLRSLLLRSLAVSPAKDCMLMIMAPVGILEKWHQTSQMQSFNSWEKQKTQSKIQMSNGGNIETRACSLSWF